MKMSLNEALITLSKAGFIVKGKSDESINRALQQAFDEYGWNEDEDQYTFEVKATPAKVMVHVTAFYDWAEREDIRYPRIEFVWDRKRSECGMVAEGERGPYLSEDEECASAEEFGDYINRQLNRNYI